MSSDPTKTMQRRAEITTELLASNPLMTFGVAFTKAGVIAEREAAGCTCDPPVENDRHEPTCPWLTRNVK